MLLAVEGGGFFSSSASGYSHGLALLLLGRKAEEKPVKVSPWNQYRLVDRETEQVYHLPSAAKDQAPGKCAPFVCFGCTANGLEVASPPKAASSSAPGGIGTSQEEASCSANKTLTTSGSISGSERRGCLKSNSKRDSLEHRIVVSEGEEPRESVEEVQTLRSSVERRKVQWTDTCGKELFEIREFETRYGPKILYFLACHCALENILFSWLCSLDVLLSIVIHE
jgi:hypothetical protein